MAPPIVLKKIAKNELILPYKLSPFGARSGLPPKIPEDMRAITIAVNEVSGVAGFVLPGNYVDVLLTSNIGRRDKLPATRTLLQNIQVLGVDQLSSEDEDKPKVVNAVTLLVTPKEGKMLSLASKVGKLGLLLRNEFDASIIAQEVVSTKTLLEAYQETKPKVTKRVRRVVPTVEVIRGLDIQKQRVQEAKP
jgi:pilus assembly protein CpaB